MKKLTTLASIAALASTLAACGSGSSSDSGEWSPDGSVELMVTGSAGGGSDLFARVFESSLADAGATVEVRNYDTVEAYLQLKAQVGDPERIVTGNYGGMVLTPQQQDLDYSWEDFTPVAILGEDVSYVVTSADSRFESFADVTAALDSGDVTIGQVQASGQNAQLTQQLETAVDATFEPVVFEGGGQQVAATLAGDVDIALMEPSEFIDQVEAGELRALVALGDAPQDPVLAGTPSAADEGLEADFVTQWRGFFAAKDITEEQLAWWEDAVSTWVESADFEEYVGQSLMQPEYLAGEELDTFLAASQESASDVR